MCYDYIFTDDPIDENKFKDLKLLFDKHSNKSGIDVIAGMSGGRDSIYQAFLLSKVFDRKVLAFTWGNDFLTIDARDAILKSSSVFRNMQMHSFSFSYDVYSVYFKAMHTVFKRFCFCAQTTIIKALPYAFDYGIPFISIGYSPDQLSGKSDYSYGTRKDRIDRIVKYVTAYRNMVLYAVKNTELSMLDRVDCELFYPALRMLENIESYDIVPGLLMLAEYMPWNYKTVEKVVYDVYALKTEGKKCLHSNCIYEPVRGYVEAIMERPFLKNEAAYIVNKGGLSVDEASCALDYMNTVNKEPKILPQFLDMLKLEKEEFHKTLFSPLNDTALDLFSSFLNAMVNLQGYTIKNPIIIVK